MFEIIDTVPAWVVHYGPIALFPLLALGIVGLPIPDEALITLAGVLINHGKWPLVGTVIAILAGSMLGITISYYLGRTAGHYLIMRYGHFVGLTTEKIKKVNDWFERIGKWTLMIGYFVPGVRHLTGYVAGTLKLSFKEFMLFAYSGAFLWSMVFLSIGHFIDKL